MKNVLTTSITLLAIIVIAHKTVSQTCSYIPYTKTHNPPPPTGANVINNPGFEAGAFSNWFNDPNEDATITSAAKHSGNYGLSAYSGIYKFKTFQKIPVLSPNQEYELTFWLKSYTGNPTITIGVDYVDENNIWRSASNSYSPSSTWQKHSITVSAGAGCSNNFEIRIEMTKSQNSGVYLDDFELLTTGDEFSFLNYSTPPAQTATFYEDFENEEGKISLNTNKWMVLRKQWSVGYQGANHGVVPENLELTGNSILFKGHGDQYTGPIQGFGGKTRVGSCIATKDYYASGSYEVRAKIAPVGVCTAFWTYHYIEDEYNSNSPGTEIKNTEIDWEFPGDDDGPQSLRKGRCNTWGGLCNGWTGEYSGRGDLFKSPSVSSINDLINSWHVYRIDWHTGGNGETPRVEWYIDDVLVDYYDHDSFSNDEDNVGFRAARFYLGVWYSSWSGLPNHDEITCEVDWVKITPFNEANDVYENETNPEDGFAPECSYPLYPAAPPIANFTTNKTSACTSEEISLSSSSEGIITSYNWDFGTNANPSTANGSGPHTVSYSSLGNKTIELTVSGPGGTDTKTITDYITIDQSYITSTITGSNAVDCDASGEPYSVIQHQGSTYAWELSGPGTITSGQGTSSILVDFESEDVTISVSESTSPNCISNPQSKNIDVCLTAIDDPKNNPLLSFIPNPFKDKGILSIHSNESNRIQLYDITGALISTIEINTDQEIEFGSTLIPGVYIIRVIDNTKAQTIRIIKE